MQLYHLACVTTHPCITPTARLGEVHNVLRVLMASGNDISITTKLSLRTTATGHGIMNSFRPLALPDSLFQPRFLSYQHTRTTFQPMRPSLAYGKLTMCGLEMASLESC